MSWLIRKLLLLLLPNYGKRAIYLTTISMEVAGIDYVDDELLEDINKEIKIVGSENALHFPASLKNVVWKGRHIDIRDPHLIDMRELEGLSNRLMRSAPEWSGYSDYNTVLKETMDVVRLVLMYKPKAA